MFRREVHDVMVAALLRHAAIGTDYHLVHEALQQLYKWKTEVDLESLGLLEEIDKVETPPDTLTSVTANLLRHRKLHTVFNTIPIYNLFDKMEEELIEHRKVHSCISEPNRTLFLQNRVADLDKANTSLASRNSTLMYKLQQLEKELDRQRAENENLRIKNADLNEIITAVALAVKR